LIWRGIYAPPAAKCRLSASRLIRLIRAIFLKKDEVMLWNASALNGYPIKATDGQIGIVADLIYDPSDWAIRWLVVDTGNWLSGRHTLLPIAALGQPDAEAHHLPVHLTMRQVEASPDIDIGDPLSDAMAAQIREHYDLPQGPDHILSDGHGKTPSDSAAAVIRERQQVDIGLHSLSEITGSSIEATDGDIGHAEDFLIDTARWQVRYMSVHASTWWTNDKRLISPLSIHWIDWARSIIHLDVTCQKVKDSIPYVAADTVDGAFDELFHSYYGIRWVRK
jgi:hypothetical protein